jgi:hypothetical protein
VYLDSSTDLDINEEGVEEELVENHRKELSFEELTELHNEGQRPVAYPGTLFGGGEE